jgi:hypothetical protein
MQRAVCGRPATGACTHCGGFCCSEHLVRRRGYGFCSACHDKALKGQRVAWVILIAVITVMAVALYVLLSS